MKKSHLLLTLLTLAPVAITIAGCNNESASVGSSSTGEASSFSGVASVTNPYTQSLNASNPSKKELVGPYTIYNEDGTTPTLTIDNFNNRAKDIPTEYENMYEALRVAGNNSTSKVILQVQDANHTQIFKRTKKTSCYVFDGADYVGIAGSVVAKTYCFSHPESYALNGIGSDYTYMGRTDYIAGQTVTENLLETSAGAYNYMFSNAGSGGTDYGYRYCTANVRLSEATYKASTDGHYWNAYIFINLQGGILSDLGLIGTVRDNKCCWYLVRNCSSAAHTAGSDSAGAKFFAYQDEELYPNCLINKSTKYDAATGVYSGFDDMKFEAFMRTDGFILNVTNLRTNKVATISDLHTEGGQPLKENTSVNGGRALIASSYCPVTGNTWNWDCGAALKNVVWDHINLRKAIVSTDGSISDNIADYRDDTLTTYSFFPDSSMYRDGYSQGAYCSSFEYGTRETSGTYKSGNTYEAGDKYLSFSVDYNH